MFVPEATIYPEPYSLFPVLNYHQRYYCPPAGYTYWRTLPLPIPLRRPVTGREAAAPLKAEKVGKRCSFDPKLQRQQDTRHRRCGLHWYIPLSERLLQRARRWFAPQTTYFTGSRKNIAHLLSMMFEAIGMTHVSALHRGRRDLQPGLPGVSDPLPAYSGPDHQDQRAWRDQHARPRQASGPDLQASTSEVIGDCDPPANRGLLGQRQSDRNSSRYDAGQALRQTLFLLLAATRAADQGRAYFPYLRLRDAAK